MIHVNAIFTDIAVSDDRLRSMKLTAATKVRKRCLSVFTWVSSDSWAQNHLPMPEGSTN